MFILDRKLEPASTRTHKLGYHININRLSSIHKTSKKHSSSHHIFLPALQLLPRRPHSAVPLSSSLNIVAVNARRRSAIVEALRSLFLLVVINVNHVESMHVAGQHAEDGEADVDEEVGAAACDDEDANGRDCRKGGCQLGAQGLGG